MSSINIVEPTIDFNYDDINILSPIQTQGNNLISKIVINNRPLYVYAPKSTLKNNKKYCDLLYNYDDIIFIQWLENIETRLKKLLLDKSKKEKWFNTVIDEEDVEDYFHSSIKIFKNGKYLVRINNIKPDKKIFNADDFIKPLSEITDNDYLTSILEIKGIKLSRESFQLTIEFMQGKIDENSLFSESHFKKKNNKKTELIEKIEEVHDELEAEPIKEQQVDKEEPKQLLLEYEDNKEKLEEVIEPEDSGLVMEEEVEPEPQNKEDLEMDVVEPEPQNKEDLDDDVFKDIEINELEAFELDNGIDNNLYLYEEKKKEMLKAKEEAIEAFMKSKNLKENVVKLYEELNELKNKYKIDDELFIEDELN
jgi:hypothetical protein